MPTWCNKFDLTLNGRVYETGDEIHQSILISMFDRSFFQFEPLAIQIDCTVHASTFVFDKIQREKIVCIQ